MIDREKVIKGLEHCFHGQECCGDIECPYYIEHLSDCCCLEECQENLKADVIALLKENGAVEPKVIRMNDFGHPVHACGECGLSITESMNYCHECGKRIKWEGR